MINPESHTEHSYILDYSIDMHRDLITIREIDQTVCGIIRLIFSKRIRVILFEGRILKFSKKQKQKFHAHNQPQNQNRTDI